MGMPFSEDVITLIMGLGDPCEPGMHGKMEEPCPTDDAVGLVTKIRDMCDEWLRSSGKCEEPCPTDNAVGLVTKIRDMCDEWLCSAGKCEGQREDKPADMASEAMVDGGDE